MAIVLDRPRPAVSIATNAVLVVALVAFGGVPVAVVVALSALAVGAWALANRPQRGLLALAALVPFDGLLVLVPHPPLLAGWKEALVLATLLATLVAPPAARAAPARLPGWAPALAGWVLLALASAVLVGPAGAVVGLKVGFFYVLAGVAAWRCPLDEWERDRLVSILLAVGAVTAVWGVLQQVLGAARLNAMGYPYNDVIRFAGGWLRSFSTFNQPFPFAFFLMLVILIGVPAALSEPGRLRSRLFLLGIPVYGLALLSTVVRGAWLGLGAGLAYLAVARYRSLLRLVPLALLAAVLVVPALVSSPAFSASSTKERTSSWRQNITRTVEHPLGTGIGTTGAAAEKVAGPGEDFYQPDSQYVKSVLELGPLGLWMFVLLLVSAFVTTHRLAASLEERGPTGTGTGGTGGGGTGGAGTGTRPPVLVCKPGAGARDLHTRTSAYLAYGVAAMVLAAGAASLVATYLEIFPMDLYFWLLLFTVSRCETAPASS